jgi:enoyl-[acyl-carrier protein] reductase I
MHLDMQVASPTRGHGKKKCKKSPNTSSHNFSHLAFRNKRVQAEAMENSDFRLDGKKALVFGVANERSLAWGIAKKLRSQGANVALTYVNEKMLRRVQPLAEEISADFVLKCDVTNSEQLQACFDKCHKQWGSIDILVHAVAFAERSDLEGRFIETSYDGFQKALQVSCYSLIEMSRLAVPMMPEGGSILTLTYHGSQQVIKHYNVMGVAKAALEASVRYLAADLGSMKIRVNAISAGPIKTLSAAGIKDFRNLLSEAKSRAPLLDYLDTEQVGELASFLASKNASAITGGVHYIDGGLSIMGSDQ